jgi:hypothetical protein
MDDCVIVYDIEEVLLTFGNKGIKAVKRLGALGYSIVGTFVFDGETTVLMQRQRIADKNERLAIVEDIKTFEHTHEIMQELE